MRAPLTALVGHLNLQVTGFPSIGYLFNFHLFMYCYLQNSQSNSYKKRRKGKIKVKNTFCKIEDHSVDVDTVLLPFYIVSVVLS